MTASRPVSDRTDSSFGDRIFDGKGYGRSYGHKETVPFPGVASVGAGAALTTIQAILPVRCWHRLRRAAISAGGVTAVSAGTDPSASIYRHLPPPDAASTLTLGATGSVDNGVHLVAVVFYNGAGSSTPGPTASITVTGTKKITVALPLGPSGTTGRKVYMTEAGAADLKLAATQADNTTESIDLNVADSGLGAAAPTDNTAATTILDSAVLLSNASRALVKQPIDATLASGVETTIFPPCIYSLRAATGALTGAITSLGAVVEIEEVEAP